MNLKIFVGSFLSYIYNHLIGRFPLANLRLMYLKKYLNSLGTGVEVGSLFEISDIVMLIYRKNFRSASGVLNTAVSYKKPCIVSSGPGPLENVVKKYDLGVWIEKDDLPSLVSGIRTWLAGTAKPQWEKYFEENSWEINAHRVFERFMSYQNI
jgi:hypothetical protein